MPFPRYLLLLVLLSNLFCRFCLGLCIQIPMFYTLFAEYQCKHSFFHLVRHPLPQMPVIMVRCLAGADFRVTIHKYAVRAFGAMHMTCLVSGAVLVARPAVSVIFQQCRVLLRFPATPPTDTTQVARQMESFCSSLLMLRSSLCIWFHHLSNSTCSTDNLGNLPAYRRLLQLCSFFALPERTVDSCCLPDFRHILASESVQAIVAVRQLASALIVPYAIDAMIQSSNDLIRCHHTSSLFTMRNEYALPSFVNCTSLRFENK